MSTRSIFAKHQEKIRLSPRCHCSARKRSLIFSILCYLAEQGKHSSLCFSPNLFAAIRVELKFLNLSRSLAGSEGFSFIFCPSLLIFLFERRSDCAVGFSDSSLLDIYNVGLSMHVKKRKHAHTCTEMSLCSAGPREISWIRPGSDHPGVLPERAKPEKHNRCAAPNLFDSQREEPTTSLRVLGTL